MRVTTCQPAMSLHELIQAHPLLQDVECGVALPPGWIGVIHDLVTKLEGISGVIISQVKPKLGGLRVYTQLGSSDDNAVNRLVSAAEHRASYTCEVCGSETASLVTTDGGWYTTRCSEHKP